MTARDYAWVFALIGGIIGALSFLAPAATYSLMGMVNINIWMFGLVNVSVSIPGYYGTSQTMFISCPTTVIVVNILCSIMILIAGGALAKTASVARQDLDDIDEYAIKWLAMGIILIVAPIVWMVMIDQYFMEAFYCTYAQMYGYSTGYYSYSTSSLLGSDILFYGYSYYGTQVSFWSIFQPGFGVIGPIIGGSLGIVGGVMARM
ncbi:MAG: hypothetical protein ACTSQJ_14975 [Promethearchaeota archaeon]